MIYARLINQTTISRNAPRQAVIDGALVVGDLPEAYLNSQNWYRLTETPMPENPQDGYHYEARYAYDSDEAPTAIVQSWEEVQDQSINRSISKYKLKLEIAKLGLLDRFREMLSGIEVAPGYGGLEAFNDATTLDEDNELVKGAKRALKEDFGLTDERIDDIVSSSLAD